MNAKLHLCLALAWAVSLPSQASAREIHVAMDGADANKGTRRAPLRTVQRAAELAQPGDVVTVHAGIYRERVNPPRGGESDNKRIIFQAAKGERVEIRGSERIKTWMQVAGDVWKVTLPNSFFGQFNPYRELIHGDWFNGKGRQHHLGAVYLNGEWLMEAAKLEEVMAAPGTPLTWLGHESGQYLLNIAWLRPIPGSARTRASAFESQKGVQTAPCSEGGDCVGWIEPGDWVRYARIDFGKRTAQVEIRAASATDGGLIELRLDRPDGDLLGTAKVPHTGDWQSWVTVTAKIKPLGGLQNVCLIFKSSGASAPELSRTSLWFGEAGGSDTVIWAQFPGVNPNEEEVEINVRPAVFYPDEPGRNFITLRGFALRHAATQWAPPTAEQIGLIGTHWSKGWVIENNVISHSICSGVALGKHGDEWDNTSQDTAEGYVKTIERGLARGWNRGTIGHHVVRNNVISHCEQTGIVGSLGSAFCTVTGNTIHDIHVRRLFTGAEMAGIKFHGAIDTVIASNHIYRTCLGLWLDWMAQGTRVSANLFHDNGRDLFLEVNHGPFVVDNNLFLSQASLLDVSEGGAYAHNLFVGTMVSSPEPNRETPFHPPHTTAMAGLARTKGGDERFYNNIFVGRGDSPEEKGSPYGLAVYDSRELPNQNGGNVFYFGARPYGKDNNFVKAAIDPMVRLVCDEHGAVLSLSIGPELKQAQTKLVNTASLGTARVSGAAYENADGSALSISRDFLGRKRDPSSPMPGPFEYLEEGSMKMRLR